jgi:hypothetical protein
MRRSGLNLTLFPLSKLNQSVLDQALEILLKISKLLTGIDEGKDTFFFFLDFLRRFVFRSRDLDFLVVFRNGFFGVFFGIFVFVLVSETKFRDQEIGV